MEEFLLRTNLTLIELTNNFEAMIATLSEVFASPTGSEREKLKVIELAEQELRVKAGKGHSKAFTVLEVILRK